MPGRLSAGLPEWAAACLVYQGNRGLLKLLQTVTTLYNTLWNIHIGADKKAVLFTEALQPVTRGIYDRKLETDARRIVEGKALPRRWMGASYSFTHTPRQTGIQPGGSLEWSSSSASHDEAAPD